MRRAMILRLNPQRPAAVPARHPSPADAESLAQLMLAAYCGTIDDEGGTIDDARREITTLFEGGYGTPLVACSFLLDRDGVLASASLVTLWEHAPLLAFSMTDPRWKRRGLSRAGLQLSIDALLDHGHDVLRLVVTRGNAPAERLYESLGFLDE